MEKLRAANFALKRMRENLPAEVRRAWGLRLRAVMAGKATQRQARMRGIDTAAHARKFRWPAKVDNKARTS